MVNSAAKRARRRKLAHEGQDRELARQTRQMDPVDLTDPEEEQEEEEVRFAPRGQSTEQMPTTPATAQAASGCVSEDIANMIRTLNGAIAALSRDTASMQKAYIQLRVENVARDKTLADLAEVVKECGLTSTSRRPHPVLSEDVMDGEGNLRAADIGITWENNETFLHGVRVVGPGPSGRPDMRPVDVDATPADGRTTSRRFAIDRPPTDTTGDVDTISTNIGTGSRPWTLISPTGDTRDGLPDATTTDGDSPRLPAGGAHTTVQQQVPKLAMAGIKTRGCYSWFLTSTRLP